MQQSLLSQSWGSQSAKLRQAFIFEKRRVGFFLGPDIAHSPEGNQRLAKAMLSFVECG